MNELVCCSQLLLLGRERQTEAGQAPTRTGAPEPRRSIGRRAAGHARRAIVFPLERAIVSVASARCCIHLLALDSVALRAR